MLLRSFNPKKFVLVGLTLILVFVAGLFYIGYFGDWKEPDCQTYPVQVSASADGSWRAEQEQEACASTDQLRTRVLVGRAGAKEQAIAFVAVTDNALGSMSVGQRSVSLDLRWEAGNRLVIVHPAWVRPQLPAGLYGGVEVQLLPVQGPRKP
jgi:hypothetical protein